MADDSRFTRIEKILDKIHLTVTNIDNTHGAKIDAVSEGFNATNQRLDGIEKRLNTVEKRLNRVETHLDGVRIHLDHVENRLGNIDKGFGNIKQVNNLLQSIANDHENRLQGVESSVRGHN
jgi:archaellum component FlaC